MNVTHVAHFGSSQRVCIRAKIEIAGLWQKLVIKSTALTHHYYHQHHRHHHHRHSGNSADPNPNTGIIIHYVRAKKGFYWAAKIAKIMNSTADVPLNYWWWSMDLFDFVGTFKPLGRCGWNFSILLFPYNIFISSARIEGCQLNKFTMFLFVALSQQIDFRTTYSFYNSFLLQSWDWMNAMNGAHNILIFSIWFLNSQ